MLLSDVTHLIPVYEHLRGKLAESGRGHWLDEEFAALADPETYIVHPEDVWQKIKHRSAERPPADRSARTCRLGANAGRKAKIRRARALSGTTALLNIAAACPDCREDLEKIRNIRKDVVTGKLGEEILEVIQKAVKIPPSAYVKPEHEKCCRSAPRPYTTFAPASENPLAGTRRNSPADCFRRRSQTAGGFFRQKKSVLRGWRFEIFGRDAVALREGKLSISYDAEHHRIEIGEKPGTDPGFVLPICKADYTNCPAVAKSSAPFRF